LLAADRARLDGLALLVWGMLDLPPALERLLDRIAEHMLVDVYLAKRAADAPSPSCGQGCATAKPVSGKSLVARGRHGARPPRCGGFTTASRAAASTSVGPWPCS
jgi:hypothetical protein